MGGLTHRQLMIEERAILLGEVGLVEATLRPAPGLHLHRQLDFLLGGEQRVTADLVEIEANRVGD